MSEHAKYEEKITITKGSTDSLHIRIPYNTAYIQRIRQITGRQWESKLKVWIIPYTVAAVQEFINQFDPNDVQITPELWVENEDLQQWKTSRGNNKVMEQRTVEQGAKVTRIQPQND